MKLIEPVTRPGVAADSRGSKLAGAAGGILALGVLFRIVSFSFSQNTGGDAWARESLTAAWLRHPNLQLLFDVWLPLHFWLMGGLALLLGGDVRLAGRLLSLILGVASLFVFWKLARELYNETAATLSLAIFCSYSIHVAYSTTSSSEATYLFFVLAGLLVFFRYLRSQKLIHLAAAGFILSLATAVRYEAWVILFATGLLLIGHVVQAFRGQPRSASWLCPLVVFGIAGGIWPCILMLYNWTKFHRPLYSVSMNHVWVADQLAFGQSSDLYRFGLFPGVLLMTLTPVVIAGGIYGLYRSLWSQPQRDFALLMVFFAGIQAYQLVSGGEMSFARYTLTLGTMTAMVAGYGLDLFACRFSPRGGRALRVAIVTLLLVNLATILLLSESDNRFSDKFASVSPRLRYMHRIGTVAGYLRPRLGPADSVIIDDYNSESNIVAQASGLPLLPGKRAFMASVRPISELSGYIQEQHPKYLVYVGRGKVREVLPLPGTCNVPATINGIAFQCLFENDVYRVYQMSYGATSAATPPTAE